LAVACRGLHGAGDRRVFGQTDGNGRIIELTTGRIVELTPGGSSN
jgi:hypothetical protein